MRHSPLGKLCKRVILLTVPRFAETRQIRGCVLLVRHSQSPRKTRRAIVAVGLVRESHLGYSPRVVEWYWLEVVRGSIIKKSEIKYLAGRWSAGSVAALDGGSEPRLLGDTIPW